jgi:DNA-directed RNA polymerase subunit beta'
MRKVMVFNQISLDGYFTTENGDTIEARFNPERYTVTKGVQYKGEEVDITLAESIIGRIARDTIRHPVTDEVIVRENDIITADIARRIESPPAEGGLGLESIRVRSPLACEARNGVCALCYGVDMSNGRLVEDGMAIGIIAAQSIGEPGTQLTMRTFHIGGTVKRIVVDSEHKAKRTGTVKFIRITAVMSALSSTHSTRVGTAGRELSGGVR